LFVVFVSILQLYCPYTPYNCEFIYQKLALGDCSINKIDSFEDWFLVGDFSKTNQTEQGDLIEEALKILAVVRKHKSENKIALNAKIDSFSLVDVETQNSFRSILNNGSILTDLKNVTGVEDFALQ